MAKPLYLALISIHGLIRGHHLELGRDADTGGQTKYVVELAHALGQSDEVEKVILLTRKIIDRQVSEDYAIFEEKLSDKASIIRIECGPEAYIAKEMLWEHLDSFSDNVMCYLKSQPRMPDLIHSHYADAGYVGSRLARQSGIPLIHTGHSLGMNKLKQLLASGMVHDAIEARYRITRRIRAEETTLSVADLVITSTQQEIEHQYGLYNFYQPERMRVIPPGTDLERFVPPNGDEWQQPIAQTLQRFLREPEKPIILALSRADPRKNIIALIDAYGESMELQQMANLVIVAGNRDDIQEAEEGAQTVLSDILFAIDKYDLYGKVAYPKQHQQKDVAVLYRLAALTRGVLVNPALTEPFGLTLIEAAASGLPIVATEDGGPRDIIKNCCNGYLINPLDKKDITQRLLAILSDTPQWLKFAEKGRQGAIRHYAWSAHVKKYLTTLAPLVQRTQAIQRIQLKSQATLIRKRAIIASLDLNLLGNDHALQQFLQIMQQLRKTTLFGIATGRKLRDALSVMRQHGIPRPDILISAQGGEIHYGASLVKDTAWERHINHNWNPKEIKHLLKDKAGLTLQPNANQTPFKISYFVDAFCVDVTATRELLQRNEQSVNVIHCFDHFLDILPIRASKGLALRWCAQQLGFELENTLVSGVTAADADMLRGNTQATVIESIHLQELIELSQDRNIYFTQHENAAGILEAMRHYHFMPNEEDT